MAYNEFGGSTAETARWKEGQGAGSAADPLVPAFAPVGRRVTLTDRSGTITSGGSAQTLMAANAARTGFYIQNSSVADLWINATGTASAGGSSLRLRPGDLYENPAFAVPTTAISIFGATTGQAFAAREF